MINQSGHPSLTLPGPHHRFLPDRLTTLRSGTSQQASAPTGIRTRYLGRPRASVRTTRHQRKITLIASNSLLYLSVYTSPILPPPQASCFATGTITNSTSTPRLGHVAWVIIGVYACNGRRREAAPTRQIPKSDPPDPPRRVGGGEATSRNLPYYTQMVDKSRGQEGGWEVCAA